MAYEVMWPDRARTYGETAEEVIDRLRGQQFHTYATTREFAQELLRRAGIYEQIDRETMRNEANDVSADDADAVLRELARRNIISLWIDGQFINDLG